MLASFVASAILFATLHYFYVYHDTLSIVVATEHDRTLSRRRVFVNETCIGFTPCTLTSQQLGDLGFKCDAFCDWKISRHSYGWGVAFTAARDLQGNRPVLWLEALPKDQQSHLTVEGLWGRAFFCTEGAGMRTYIFFPQPSLDCLCMSLNSVIFQPSEKTVTIEYSFACSGVSAESLSRDSSLRIECELTNIRENSVRFAKIVSREIVTSANGVVTLSLVIDDSEGERNQMLRTRLYCDNSAGESSVIAEHLCAKLRE